MAPEQLEGKRCDARTDIFALGLVLYEMIVGKRLSLGQQRAALVEYVPPQLAHVIERCIEINPEDRWQSARDVKAELEWGRSAAAPLLTQGKPRPLWPWAIGTLVLAATLGYAIALLRSNSRTDTGGTFRLSVLLPEGAGMRGQGRQFALSPDGNRLAMALIDAAGRSQLWVHSLDSTLQKPLPNTDMARAPFWSPDGDSIGFFSQGKLKKIDVSGGPPVTLADTEDDGGGAWNESGVILFSKLRSGLFRVSSNGGEATPVTTIDSANGEVHHSRPAFLPDGNHFIYLASGSRKGGPFDPSGLFCGSLGSKDRKLLLEDGSNAEYADDHLMFIRQRA